MDESLGEEGEEEFEEEQGESEIDDMNEVEVEGDGPEKPPLDVKNTLLYEIMNLKKEAT